MASLFGISYDLTQGVRFNWYRDGRDWKPFHHDAAAFNVSRSREQNCTAGMSLGASRDLAFRHAKTGDVLSFPQTNGMLFFFGRDVNIRWQHGLTALPLEEQSDSGRISCILWGLCHGVVEEADSPQLLRGLSQGGPLKRGQRASRKRKTHAGDSNGSVM